MTKNDEGYSSVPNWVIRNSNLDAAEKLTYIALLNRANSEGECWPSLATISADVRSTIRTVSRKLESLEAKGLIRKIRRSNAEKGNVSNLYKVLTYKTAPPMVNLSIAMVNEPIPPCAILPKAMVNEPIEVLPSEVQHTLSTLDQFDVIWDKYPKKVGKGKAREAFEKALKKTSIDTISDSIDNHVKFWEGTELQFIPHFATWLNQERWSDEVAVPSDRKVRVKDQWMVR